LETGIDGIDVVVENALDPRGGGLEKRGSTIPEVVEEGGERSEPGTVGVTLGVCIDEASLGLEVNGRIDVLESEVIRIYCLCFKPVGVGSQRVDDDSWSSTGTIGGVVVFAGPVIDDGSSLSGEAESGQGRCGLASSDCWSDDLCVD
jgi:hypothetical protein